MRVSGSIGAQAQASSPGGRAACHSPAPLFLCSSLSSMRAGTTGLGGGGCSGGGAGARLFFFCRSICEPRDTFSDGLSCAGGPVPVPGRGGGGGARRFFMSDFTDTPEMLLSERDGPKGAERGFTAGEFGVVTQPCQGKRQTSYQHQETS